MSQLTYQRRRPDRIALFFRHYALARRYTGRVRAIFIAFMFARAAR